MRNLVEKIVLGTVQFGLDYGVNNSAGQVEPCEILSILQLAGENNISILDTSSAYGNAEKVLGKLLPEIDYNFKLISKYPKNDLSVSCTLYNTLENLRVDSLYGYLLHHFEMYREYPGIWEEFKALKESQKVEKIGFSIYTKEELELILSKGDEFDIIQFPYNILDRQFEPYLEVLHRRNVEIYARSTFLQGLFFMDREKLPIKLQALKKYLCIIDDYASLENMSVTEVAINYNLQNKYIDGVLIGVDNATQLADNIRSVLNKRIDLSIDVEETELLNPSNWYK
ncbi:aldo/keto reductase [Bacteroides sp. GD17]|jgi:aryl-alcohol dehydrogenase-like predicted oxidoreductase|uniref:aldo/keto reductase n=1 Tax=Bacteroides sp. GD17 TaxID=3139826 RepID=UPI0025D92D65|nr:aldo/keto reductase [uncultured Bacteroides sp.]